ncbi:galectin-related protein A-like [Pogoniulus pusillus]|uniref:galectin-related protein A-like n=1 Tax=Pogoniulus pusillus TaxID=488313 RepID=UPI0030B97A01
MLSPLPTAARRPVRPSVGMAAATRSGPHARPRPRPPPQGTTPREASVRSKAAMTEERRPKVEQYVGEIKGGLRPAMKLTVIGMVHSNPKSFSVTLLCDPVDANKDVGLLFTVNFSDKSITRNARIAGKWGREEKVIPYFPFTAGDTFKMELLCEHQQIRVLLDGRQLCDFTHRIQPLNLVKALQITGDIKLTKVA